MSESQNAQAAAIEEKHQQVLALLKNYPPSKKCQNYEATKDEPNADTILCVDAIPFHSFRIEAANLVKPVEEKLTMSALRCLERPLPSDWNQGLIGGTLKFALGHMASNQPTALINKTFVISYLMSDPKDQLTTINDLFFTYNMGNPFEKEVLLFPCFRKTCSTLAVVTNPQRFLRNEDDEDMSEFVGPKPAIFFFVAGAELDPELMPRIEYFFKLCAVEFETDKDEDNEVSRTFDSEHLETNVFVPTNIPECDQRPLAILSIMKEILTADDEFPDMHLIGTKFRRTTIRQFRENADSFRLNLADTVRPIAESCEDEIIQFILRMRADVIAKRRNAGSDVITLD